MSEDTATAGQAETRANQLEADIAARDGDLPGHLEEAAAPDIDGTGLTSDMLYGDDKPPPEPEKPAPEPEKKPPEPEKKPSAETSEPKAQEKPSWDKDRQAKDQEIAALRKQVEDLNGKLASSPPADKSGQEPPAEPQGEDSDLGELDEFATEADRNAAVNKLIARERAREAEATNRSNLQAYEALLAEADKDYGPEHRNEAVKRMADLWKEQGFGPGKYPDAATTRVALRGVYAQLALEKSRSDAAKERPRDQGGKFASGKAPAMDTGRGGAPAFAESSGMESLDDALDAMKREGKFNG